MKIIIGIIIGLFLVSEALGNSFSMNSSAFHNLGNIPVIYTCDGENISPPLSWKNPPEKTQSFLLIVYNPDAPWGTYYNWILYNIPKKRQFLEEKANKKLPSEDIRMGKTSSGDVIYRGPCPPNAAIHHYIFKLYALNTTLDIPPGTEAEEILNIIQNHILGEAELVGIYNH